MFGQHVLDASKALDERRGGLLADASDAGDVVDRVANQTHDVDDLLGADAEALAHRPPRPSTGRASCPTAVVGGPTSCIRSLSPVTTTQSTLRRGMPPRQGADDVVGFDARNRHGADVECFDHFMDQRPLGREVRRHLRPVALYSANIASRNVWPGASKMIAS